MAQIRAGAAHPDVLKAVVLPPRVVHPFPAQREQRGRKVGRILRLEMGGADHGGGGGGCRGARTAPERQGDAATFPLRVEPELESELHPVPMAKVCPPPHIYLTKDKSNSAELPLLWTICGLDFA